MHCTQETNSYVYIFINGNTIIRLTCYCHIKKRFTTLPDLTVHVHVLV